MSYWSNALSAAMELQGAVGAALVDLETGACMALAEREEKDSLSAAAVVNAQMLRAQIRLAQEQKFQESLDDLQITIGQQYHLVRPVRNGNGGVPSMFLYLVMDRSQASLAITRRKMIELEERIAQTAEIDRRVESVRHIGQAADKKSDLPAFMRDDHVMRLLGLTSRNGRDDLSATSVSVH